MHLPISHEEFLTPEATLPAQFARLWHGVRKTTPERALASSVLWQAIRDLEKFRYARRRRRQRLYREAYEWIASESRAWPYSFVNICEFLGLSPECLRAELLERSVPDRDQAA